MKRALAAAAVLCAAMGSSTAGVYTHIDPVSGMTVVSNIPAAKGEARAPAGAVSAGQAAFPRVSGEQQKQRDGTRRDILQAELSAEQQALDAARARQEVSEIVRRHVANVEALKRELAGAR